jgi:glycine cleavage system H lipoate-binding protein
MVILIIIAFVVACVSIDALVKYFRQRMSKIASAEVINSRVFNEGTVLIPKGLYFDKTHTWAFMEKNGFVKIGIDDFLLHITGPLNRLKMKSPGEKISKGEPVLSLIQNGKQLTINAPISGTIKSINDQLAEDSALVNFSPYSEGWVYTIEPTNWLRDMQFLLMADKYSEWLKNEFSKLKDFLAISSNSGNLEFAPVMMQDGGELIENVLENLSPEVWEEFQIKFINNSYDINWVAMLRTNQH